MATTASDAPRVDIQLACRATGVPDRRGMERWFAAASAAAGATAGAAVTVRIVDEAEGRRLNREFRDVDRATNVLSFPAALGDLPGLPAAETAHLGDLVLCAPVVEREAAEQDKAAADHWAHLLVHGYLHLLGYDHESHDEARVMEGLEARILAGGGIENPYGPQPS